VNGRLGTSRKCQLRRVRAAYGSKGDIGQLWHDVFMSSRPSSPPRNLQAAKLSALPLAVRRAKASGLTT